MSRSSRRGFTLVELLVVIGILIVLLAILLPALGRAKAQADGVICQSNCRTLMQGFTAFANDHDGHLPGTFAVRNSWDYDTSHWDWLFGIYSSVDGVNQQATRAQYAPQSGTLWPYVHKAEAYLCPTLQNAVVGSGVGSNGHFDYAAYAVFCGARIQDIKQYSLMRRPVNPYVAGSVASVVELPTPIICHENSSTLNGSNIEGQHANLDRITDVHLNGGGYYAAIDGSAYFVIEPNWDYTNGGNLGSNLWSSITPSGATQAINGDPGNWNWWAHQ